MIMASDIKFGKDTEWTTDAANLETWLGMSYQTVLAPANEITGTLIDPKCLAPPTRLTPTGVGRIAAVWTRLNTRHCNCDGHSRRFPSLGASHNSVHGSWRIKGPTA